VVARAVLKSELVIFEYGHMPFVEEQDRHIEVVRDFLDRSSQANSAQSEENCYVRRQANGGQRLIRLLGD
jgi:hypothetical protein